MVKCDEFLVLQVSSNYFECCFVTVFCNSWGSLWPRFLWIVCNINKGWFLSEKEKIKRKERMYLWLELSFFGGLKLRLFSIPISVDVHSKVGRALNFLFSSVAWLFLFASFLDVSLNSLSSFYILSFWLLHHERGVSSLPSCTHQSLIFVMTEFHPRTLV